ALVGCAVGPRYHRPATQVTPAFRGQDRAEAASFADLPWWEAFGDEPLAALINEALANSYDLADAVARVDIARENIRVSTDALLPSIGISGGPSYQQIFSGFSAALPSTPGGPSFPTGNFAYPAYAVSASLSWEIDLWGRLRRLREAALADFFASEDNRRGVIVSLIGAIAGDYFTLLSLDLQLEIARRTVEARQETLDLFAKREAGGVGDRLQTASEEAILAGAAATIPDLERQIVAVENELSILVGRPPGPIRRGGGLLTRPAPPPRPAGAPSALLERRPDVRQAEAHVIAANAQVGAAFAQLFPQVSVAANGGFQSSSLPELFTTGALTYGVSLLVNWLAPLLAGAANAHRYRAQEAAWRAAVADYRRAVLVALAETSNALVTIDKLREVRVQLEVSVRARVESVQLAKVRYNNGVASYLDVVQAEQNLFPAELQLAQTLGQQLVATTQLYRALGGGWQSSEGREVKRDPARPF
ncbi:MAG TPA: efflux transporter outer membrane subunit, partial [Polyangia bacterium]